MGVVIFSYDRDRKEMNYKVKKFLTFILMVVLAIIALTHVDQIIGFAINLVILYFAFRQYLKSTSTCGKVLWGIIGLMALFAGLHHFSAIVGILAIALFYIVYKDWKKTTYSKPNNEDPFTNFEKQWEQMKKNHF